MSDDLKNDVHLADLPEDERRSVYVEAAARLLVPAALVILLVGVLTAGFVWWDARERARSNHTLIERIERSEAAQKRQERRADRRQQQALTRVRDAALRACREIEQVKERIRATVRVDEAEFKATLRELDIDPDSPRGRSLLARARANEAETLARFAPQRCRLTRGA